MISLKFPITWTSIFRQNIRLLYKYVSLSSFIFNEILFFGRVKSIQSDLGSQILADFEEAFQGAGAKVSFSLQY